MDRISVLVVLLLSVSSGELSELLHYMSYARFAHEWWAEHIGEYPQYIEVVGDREWNMKWVETYSKVIRCLELLLRLKEAISDLLGSDDMLSFRTHAVIVLPTHLWVMGA
mgnify:CR=1 FL=1